MEPRVGGEGGRSGAGRSPGGPEVAGAPEGPAPAGNGDAGRDLADRLRTVVVLCLGLGAAILLILLLFPFLPALVTSAVLATLGYPGHRKVRQWVRQPDLAALVTTTAIFFLVLLPTLALSVILINQVRQGVEWLGGVVGDATAPGGFVQAALAYLADALGVEVEGLSTPVSEQLSDILGLLARRTLGFLSGLGGWLLQAGAALFTLFYFLRDADGLMRHIKWLVPLDPPTTQRLLERTRDVIYATVYGNVVVAIVQGTLGGLAFWVLGLPAAALWGSVMGVLSLLPVVGATFVWLPAAAIQMLQGRIGTGIALLAFGAVVISTVDNYLRAVLIGDRTQLHSLVVFFSVLAGLFAFGAVGIFVGPVLFVIAFSLLELARAALDGGDTDILVPSGSAGSEAGGRGAVEDGIFQRAPPM